MRTVKDCPIKRKRDGSSTSEDSRLLRLLRSRRRRLEKGIDLGWDRIGSLELDLLIAMEERVLSGSRHSAKGTR